MLKKILVFVLFASAVLAQDKIDSILTSMRSKPTLEKIKALSDFCWKYRDISPKLAIRAGEISLLLAESIGDKHNESKSLNYLSVIYRDQGEYEKSLNLANRGLDIAETAKDKTEEAYSYNNISSIYRLMGNYPAAIEKLYKALEIFEEIKDTVGIGYCYYNLGFIYLKQESYAKALDNYNKTIEIRTKLGDAEGNLKALSRIAEIYLQKGENQKAFSLFREVEAAYNNINDKRSLIVIKMGLAELFARKKDYKNAIHERKDALLLSEQFQDVAGIVTNASMLGILYALQNNFTEGKKLLQKAEATALKVNSSELKITSYKSYADYYELQKDYKSAFNYAKMLRQIQDSVAEKERTSVISEVEYTYAMTKREKEKVLLQQQINFSIVIGILMVVLIIVTGILYFFKRRTTTKLTELNATRDKFFSIIAHDLKNPITSQFGLTSLIIEDYDELSDEECLELIKAVDVAGKQTYKLLENLLYWSRSQTGRLEYVPREINLNKLVEESFSLLLENAKIKGVILSPVVETDIYAFGDEDMIKTVLRNLISNAIKFSNKGNSVKVLFDEINEQKIVSVIDDGVGIPQEGLGKIFRIDTVASSPGTSGERGTGLGLILCKEFVEKNGGKIWVESTVGKGSKFSFSLPSTGKFNS